MNLTADVGRRNHDRLAALQGREDAGIDPAFDNTFDELERQFAELRLANIND